MYVTKLIAKFFGLCMYACMYAWMCLKMSVCIYKYLCMLLYWPLYDDVITHYFDEISRGLVLVWTSFRLDKYLVVGMSFHLDEFSFEHVSIWTNFFWTRFCCGMSFHMELFLLGRNYSRCPYPTPYFLLWTMSYSLKVLCTIT